MNLSMARASEASFGHRSGTDPEAALVLGNFSQQDQEHFIR
jgi:hypothetical protein